ncbi:MAG: manganese efflux pump [Victivallales bacterium]|nr:manganese efflux pump [Victivallales bacterium]
MTPLSVSLIALALSMDAFAVSIATGASIKKNRMAEALRMGLIFGVFQATMPLLGAILGKALSDILSAWGHWTAFTILSAIGLKMIYEAHFLDKEQKKEKGGRLPFRTLILLGVATSIDALAAGFSLSLIVGPAVFAIALVIGAVTFIVCTAGVFIGGHAGHALEDKIETAAGVILITVGLQILLTHP